MELRDLRINGPLLDTDIELFQRVAFDLEAHDLHELLSPLDVNKSEAYALNRILKDVAGDLLLQLREVEESQPT